MLYRGPVALNSTPFFMQMASQTTGIAVVKTRRSEQTGSGVIVVRCNDSDHRAHGDGRREADRVPDGQWNDVLRTIPTETRRVAGHSAPLSETRRSVHVAGQIVGKCRPRTDDDEYIGVTRHVLR